MATMKIGEALALVLRGSEEAFQYLVDTSEADDEHVPASPRVTFTRSHSSHVKEFRFTIHRGCLSNVHRYQYGRWVGRRKWLFMGRRLFEAGRTVRLCGGDVLRRLV